MCELAVSGRKRKTIVVEFNFQFHSIFFILYFLKKLNRNQLIDLPVGMSRLEQLQMLYVAENRLQSLSVVESLTNLIKLEVYRC